MTGSIKLEPAAGATNSGPCPVCGGMWAESVTLTVSLELCTADRRGEHGGSGGIPPLIRQTMWRLVSSPHTPHTNHSRDARGAGDAEHDSMTPYYTLHLTFRHDQLSLNEYEQNRALRIIHFSSLKNNFSKVLRLSQKPRYASQFPNLCVHGVFAILTK